MKTGAKLRYAVAYFGEYIFGQLAQRYLLNSHIHDDVHDNIGIVRGYDDMPNRQYKLSSEEQHYCCHEVAKLADKLGLESAVYMEYSWKLRIRKKQKEKRCTNNSK